MQRNLQKKLKLLKKHTSLTRQVVVTKSIIEEGESDELIESNSSMDRYVSTLRKTQPKN